MRRLLTFFSSAKVGYYRTPSHHNFANSEGYSFREPIVVSEGDARLCSTSRRLHAVPSKPQADGGKLLLRNF